MLLVQSLSDLSAATQDYPLVLLFFTRKECDTCAYVQSQLEKLSRRCPDMLSLIVSLDDIPAASSRYSMFAVPGVLVYAQGKPVIIVSNEFSLANLGRKVDELYRNLKASSS